MLLSKVTYIEFQGASHHYMIHYHLKIKGSCNNTYY